MPAPGSMLLVNCRIFDGTGGEEIEGGSIWIQDGEIRRVGRADQFSDVGDEVYRFDVEGRLVMPGLTEPHSHLSYWSAATLHDVDINATAEQAIIHALLNGRTMLRSGYTSAYGFGSLHATDTTVRDAFANGLAPGPRLIASGRDILGTAGMYDWHPDYQKIGMEGLPLLADDPWEVRKLIRKVRKAGADNAKVYLDGELMIPSCTAGELSYTQEEASVAVDEGHRRNLQMICHARSAGAVKQAMIAGFDIVGHANYLDDEALGLLTEQKHRVFVTPAIHFQVGAYENGEPYGLSSAALDEMGYKDEIVETIASVRRMKEAGIRVLPGGDFGLGWAPHGTYARDLQNFVELFNYTPREALLAATRDAGAMIDPGGRLGTLEAGKWADLIVVDGDPLEDITLLQDHANIRTVVKEGKIFHNTLPGAPRFDLNARAGFTPGQEDALFESMASQQNAPGHFAQQYT